MYYFQYTKAWFTLNFIADHALKFPLSTFVKVDQLVIFPVKLRSYGISATCRLQFPGLATISYDDTDESIQHRFHQPSVYTAITFCNAYGKRFFSPSISIHIQSDLSNPIFDTTCSSQVQSMERDLILKCQHTYVYPVDYHLVFRHRSIGKSSGAFDSNKFQSKAIETVQFTINVIDQAIYTPGTHNIALILENQVSLKETWLRLTFYRPIRRMSVQTTPFVSSVKFPIEVDLGYGAPANITVEIQRYPSKVTVATIQSSCSGSATCGIVVVMVSVPATGVKYQAVVNASNAVSSITRTSAPFEAHPEIYDVYIMPRQQLYVNKEAVLLVFVRGDPADWKISLSYAGNTVEFPFTIGGSQNIRTIAIQAPIDIQLYKQLEIRGNFPTAGSHEITSVVYEANDSKQKFTFREKVFVQDTPTCLNSVEIRDGSNTQDRKQPLKIATRAVFSVKTQFTCAGIARYSYEWKVLKYEGSRDLIRNEVTFMGTKDGNAFLIKQFDLNPNYYIINVNVTLFDERNQSIGEKSAFTLINVVKLNMSVFLQSGTVRHIGKYPLVCAYLYDSILAGSSLQSLCYWYTLLIPIAEYQWIATIATIAVFWLVQGSPNYGPRAKSGPRSHFIRPA